VKPDPYTTAFKLVRSIFIPRHAEAGEQQFKSLAHAYQANSQLKLDPHWIYFYANASKLILIAANLFSYLCVPRLIPLLLFNNIDLSDGLNKIRPLISYAIMISLLASEQTELLSAESLTKYSTLISFGFLFEKAFQKMMQDYRGVMRTPMHDYASLLIYACLFPLVWAQANYFFSSVATESARTAALTTFNLTDDASEKDIKNAYRFFTWMCHGDLGGNCMTDINAAKEILLPRGSQP
jgi:hypothetical protein